MFNQLLGKYGGALKSRKALVIIAFLIIVFGSMAWRASLCSIEAVPFQFVYLEDQPVTTLYEAEASERPMGFPAFVKAVTGHLAAKLTREGICLNNTKSKEHSLLQFTAWVVNANLRSLPSVPPLGEQSSGVCRITSPWVDLVVERKPVPLVRGVFRYNERQLLADQAVLAGAGDVPSGVAMPITYDEFRHYADFEYAPSEITHQPVKNRKTRQIPPRLTPYITGKEFRQYVGLEHLSVETDYYYPAEKPIEERVPSDLLWLFRRARQDPDYGTFGPALGSMGLAMGTSSKSYTKIVIKLIDRCFESEGADIHYDSILDLDDPVLFEEYRVVWPIITELGSN